MDTLTYIKNCPQFFDGLDSKYLLDSKTIFHETFGTNGLLTCLIQKDIESIGTQRQTENANNLENYIKGFMDLGNSNHCFWAGINARKKAIAEVNYKTDTSYLILTVLFNICYKLLTCKIYSQEKLTDISFAISRIYASQTTGIAKIFISSDKPTESVGWTIGTNLWEAELPVLWNLYHRRVIKDIQLYIDNGILGNSNWNNGISIINYNCISLPIYRRTWHSLDSPDTKSSFVVPGMVQSDYDQWRLTAPRKFITTTRLKVIINKFKKNIKK